MDEPCDQSNCKEKWNRTCFVLEHKTTVVDTRNMGPILFEIKQTSLIRWKVVRGAIKTAASCLYTEEELNQISFNPNYKYLNYCADELFIAIWNNFIEPYQSNQQY